MQHVPRSLGWERYIRRGKIIPSVRVRAALVHGIAIALFITGCMVYWFAVADRPVVFLYFHDMQPLGPVPSPFGPITVSRYWMTGLVAGGAVLLLYGLANRLAARWRPGYRPPPWQHVWLVAAPLLTLALAAVTLTQNEPTLPLPVSLRVIAVALAALALALPPGRWAAACPGDLLWLAADGWGVALLLLTLVHLDKVPFWLAHERAVWVAVLGAGALAGVAWLLFMGWLRRRGGRSVPGAGRLLLAGACIAYLLLPLVHYLIGTDGYFYITNSDNFFARNPAMQAGAWLLTAVVGWGVTRVRGSTRRRECRAR